MRRGTRGIGVIPPVDSSHFGENVGSLVLVVEGLLSPAAKSPLSVLFFFDTHAFLSIL
jgi:hypothetical protein